MITLTQIRSFLKNLLSSTASKVKESQSGITPLFLETEMNTQSLSGYHNKLSVINVESYRYDSHWHYYRHNIDSTEETFGILKIDNIFTTNQLNKLTEKQFSGTINTLIYRDLIKPFILILDGKIVPWNIMEFIYDCGDTWLILRGEKYSHSNLNKFKKVNIILWPFKIEHISSEEDNIFDARYRALNDYMQNSVSIRNNKMYILSPSLNTTHNYNGTVYNIGGWAYEQMKLYKLGMLSEDRINRLRNIQITRLEYNEYNEIISSEEVKYNLLDTDVPTNGEIYNYVYGYNKEEYESAHDYLSFNDNGLYDSNGNYKYYILDEDIIIKRLHVDDTYIWDLSDIDALLFRENFTIFIDGYYNQSFELLSSINNITLIPNPNKRSIDVLLIYNKYANHVISNADRFKKSYMNAQATKYLETLISVSENNNNVLPNTDENYIPRYIDAFDNDNNIYTNITTDPESEIIITEDGHDPKSPGKASLLNKDIRNNVITDYSKINNLHAQTDPEENAYLRNLTMYVLKEEAMAVPRVLDYVVFISKITESQEEALDIISRVIEPLDFQFDNNLTIDENLDNNLKTVINYDVELLNPLINTSIESFTINGEKANKALIRTFMYEKRRGLKIPRKSYNDHETYFMIFINGELFPEYYRTIVYANFFFIPIDNNFYFNDSDQIEIVYYKDVNNNEIRFKLSNWLLNQFTNNKYDSAYFNTDIFNKWIGSDELKIFSHYPKNMMIYDTLIPEGTEDIAFNISYRDKDNQLCIKKDGISHIINDSVNKFLNNNKYDNDMSNYDRELLSNMDIDSYINAINTNTYIIEKGTNILSKNDDNIENMLVACSKHKFVYQRLFVKYKSYRIKLDKRFRYCDNPKQYLLFVNGRRQRQDSFLITIPKHTRPFNDIYLYTTVFVGPSDRVELFYLPYEMTDINFPIDKRYELKSDGYLELPRDMLDVPLSNELYMFFINGKKIPSAYIQNVDSNTIRLSIDTNTLHYPMITSINTSNIDSVYDYMHDEKINSKYDSLIKYIKNRSNGINLLDKMFNIYTKINDLEEDKLWMNVAKIAILNEVIRDFWVTRGYDYANQDIVYDYDHDEYFERLEDGTLILPALNAVPDINIIKNDISLLYFYTDPSNLLCEYGNTLDLLTFYWEYTQRINQQINIISQSINGIDIGTETRTWSTNPGESGVNHYKFVANTGQQYIIKEYDINYVNATYWGVLDYRSLQYYEMIHKYQYMDELVAVVPKNKILPSKEQLELESGNIYYKGYIEDHYNIIYNLTYQDMLNIPVDIWEDPRLTNIYNNDFIAICDNGRIIYNPELDDPNKNNNIVEYDLRLDYLGIYDNNGIFTPMGINDINNEIAEDPLTSNIIYEDHNIVVDTFVAIANETQYKYKTDFIIVDEMPGYIDDEPFNIENINNVKLYSIDENSNIINNIIYSDLKILDSEQDMQDIDILATDSDIEMFNYTFIAITDEMCPNMDQIMFGLDLDTNKLISLRDLYDKMYLKDLESGVLYDTQSINLNFYEDAQIQGKDLHKMYGIDLESGLEYDLDIDNNTFIIRDLDGNIISKEEVTYWDMNNVEEFFYSSRILRDFYIDTRLLNNKYRHRDNEEIPLSTIIMIHDNSIINNLDYIIHRDNIHLETIIPDDVRYRLIYGYEPFMEDMDTNEYIFNRFEGLNFIDIDENGDISYSTSSLEIYNIETNEIENDILYKWYGNSTYTPYDKDAYRFSLDGYKSSDNYEYFETIEGLTYDKESKLGHNRFEDLNVFFINNDSFLAITPSSHFNDDNIQLLDIDGLTQLYLENGLDFIDLDDPKHTKLNGLTIREINAIEQMYFYSRDMMLDLDSGTYMNLDNIIGTDDQNIIMTNIFDEKGNDNSNNIFINDIDSDNILFGYKKIFKNLIYDDQLKRKVKEFINILTPLSALSSTSNGVNYVENLSYIQEVKKSIFIDDQFYIDEFGNTIYMVNEPYQYFDIENNQYITDVSYLIDDQRYDTDSKDWYTIKYKESNFPFIHFDANNGLVLDSLLDKDIQLFDIEYYKDINTEDTLKIINLIRKEYNYEENYYGDSIMIDLETGEEFDIADNIDAIMDDGFIINNALDNNSTFVIDISYNLEKYFTKWFADGEPSQMAIYDIHDNVCAILDMTIDIASLLVYDIDLDITYESQYLKAYDYDNDVIYSDIILNANVYGNGIDFVDFNASEVWYELNYYPIEDIIIDNENAYYYLTLNGFYEYENGEINDKYDLSYTMHDYENSIHNLFDPLDNQSFYGIVSNKSKIEIEQYIPLESDTYEIHIERNTTDLLINNSIWVYFNNSIMDSKILFETLEIWDMKYNEVISKENKLVDPTYKDGFKAITNTDDMININKIIEDENWKYYEMATDSLEAYNVLENKFIAYDINNNIYEDIEFLLDNFINNHGDNYNIEINTYAIDLNTGSNLNNLIYIDDPIEEPIPQFNFFNIAEFGVPDAYCDNGVIIYNDSTSYIDITKPYGYNIYNQYSVLDIDRFNEFRYIYHTLNDMISDNNYTYLIGNIRSDILVTSRYDIDSIGSGIIKNNSIDNFIYDAVNDMTYSANKYSQKQYFGIYDINNSNNMLNAILNGTAHIIKSIDFNIDNYGDDYDVITYELDDNIYAQSTSDGTLLTDLEYKKYEETWTQIGITNISDANIIAINNNDPNNRYNSITFVYDMSNPYITYYYNEEDLPAMIYQLDKYLVDEPAYVELKNYKIGNYNYFIFACPKRLVYNSYNSMISFTLPDINNTDILSHCYDSATLPIYTNGKKDGEYVTLNSMSMDYIGEHMFTNDYGYSELYMMWKSNGYFTRLYDNYGINITIKVGITNDKSTIFYDRIRYYDGIDNTDNNQIQYYNNNDYSIIEEKNLTRTNISGYISNVKNRTDLEPEYYKYILQSQGLFSQF